MLSELLGNYVQKQLLAVDIVPENYEASIREMTRELEISRESIRMIMVDILGMQRVLARLNPINLIFFSERVP